MSHAPADTYWKEPGPTTARGPADRGRGHEPRVILMIAVVGVAVFLFAHSRFGAIGFMAGAIIGEGPGIAEEHALLNQQVFGIVGGLWSAYLAMRGLWVWFTRP